MTAGASGAPSACWTASSTTGRRTSGLAACHSQMEAIRHIADRDGGYVQVSFAVKEIAAAGLSRAQSTTLYANLWHLMDSADDFEWVSSGSVLPDDLRAATAVAGAPAASAAEKLIENPDDFRPRVVSSTRIILPPAAPYPMAQPPAVGKII